MLAWDLEIKGDFYIQQNIQEEACKCKIWEEIN